MNSLENIFYTQKEKNATNMWKWICIAVSFSKINYNFFLLLFMHQILYKDLPEFVLLLFFTILKR